MVRSVPPAETVTSGSDVCAVVHAYYPELFGEIVEHLGRCVSLRHVIVTYCDPNVENVITATAAPLVRNGVAVDTVLVDNRGRDMLPFVTVAPQALATGCRAFIKLHTKRSPHLGDEGDRWRRELLDGLLPDPLTIAGVSRWCTEEPNVGFGVPGRYLGTWAHRGKNHRNVRRLARRIGLRAPLRLLFPAGGMYWCTADWLAAVVSLGLTKGDFEQEAGQVDGTTAHALERLIGCYAMSRRAVLWLPEDSRGRA